MLHNCKATLDFSLHCTTIPYFSATKKLMIVVILIVGMNTVLILKYNEVSRLNILEKNANDFTMFMENSLIAVISRVESIRDKFKEQEDQLRKTQMLVESSNLGN